jgi:regulator of sigma E protease
MIPAMTDLLLKIGSIVLLLGGLIFVHELGHFIAAKLLGVKVVRFSIGFGPRLFGFTRGETEYRIAALPLGGYVKMAGDDPGEETAPEDRGRGFLEQRPWRRFVIAAAGPAMNLAFPVVLYLAITLVQNGEPTPGPVVGTVTPGSPADEAGLRPADRVIAVRTPAGETRPIRWFVDLREVVSPFPGATLLFEIERGGERLAPIAIRPASQRESNPVEVRERGVIGVSPYYPAAVVAPRTPGAAGPVEPFDVVVKVAGAPVKHAGDLDRALAAAGCRPVAMEVLRERPARAPGVAVSSYEPLALEGVPTCAGGARSLALADPDVSTFVAAVTPGGPADEAGLRRGDAIAAVNGKPVRSFRDFNALAQEFKAGQPVALAVAGGRELRLVPGEESFVDPLTKEKRGRVVLGFAPDPRSVVEPGTLVAEQVPLKIGPVEAAQAAWRQLHEVVRLTVLGIAKIVTGDISFKTVGGPIMLFSIAAQAAEDGLETFLFQMALISVNLGLMNLLPIPVLDGGHIATCLVEWVTRRPLSVRTREIANMVGLVLLVVLMLFVFKNDIVRLVG